MRGVLAGAAAGLLLCAGLLALAARETAEPDTAPQALALSVRHLPARSRRDALAERPVTTSTTSAPTTTTTTAQTERPAAGATFSRGCALEPSAPHCRLQTYLHGVPKTGFFLGKIKNYKRLFFFFQFLKMMKQRWPKCPMVSIARVLGAGLLLLLPFY